MNKIAKDLYSIHLKEGKIERLETNDFRKKIGHNIYQSNFETIMIVDKINELIDAVNELQKERLGK